MGKDEVINKDGFSALMAHIQNGNSPITGFRSQRLKWSSPDHDIERVLVLNFNNEFVTWHGSGHLRALSILVYGTRDETFLQHHPKRWLTGHEAKIVLSIIQWLGTNCGIAFLSECGFRFDGDFVKLPRVPEKPSEKFCEKCGKKI